jgi:hypothetical protein
MAASPVRSVTNVRSGSFSEVGGRIREVRKSGTLPTEHMISALLPTADIAHGGAYPFRVQPTDAPAFARLIPSVRMRCSRAV